RVRRLVQPDAQTVTLRRPVGEWALLLLLLLGLGVAVHTAPPAMRPALRSVSALPQLMFRGWESRSPEPFAEVASLPLRPFKTTVPPAPQRALTVIAPPDSLKKRRNTITLDERDGDQRRRIKLEMEGDEVKKLRIDGRNIPQEELDDYRETIDELLNSVVTPDAPHFPSAPIPPVPKVRRFGHTDGAFWFGTNGPRKPFVFEDDFPHDAPHTYLFGDADEQHNIIVAPGGGSGLRFRRDSSDNDVLIITPSGRQVQIFADSTDGYAFRQWSSDEVIDLNDMLDDADRTLSASLPALDNTLLSWQSLTLPALDNTLLSLQSLGSPSIGWLFPPDSTLWTEEERAAYRAEMDAYRASLEAYQAERKDAMDEYRAQMESYRARMREEQAEMRKQQVEMRAELREQQEALRRQQAALSARYRQEQEEQWEVQIEQSKKQLKSARTELKAHREVMRRGLDAVEAQLLADDLLADPDVYSYELRSDRLVIDGKSQPAATLRRYVKIYEEAAGNELGRGYEVSVDRSDRPVKRAIEE
ncbi:MAG: hypothetical protein WBA12_13485, partial [Catalinimonas sp.]